MVNIKRLIVMIIVVLVLLITTFEFAYGSVIKEGSSSNGFVTIDCLGDDNEVFIYAKDTENEQGVLSYSSSCDVTKKIKEIYFQNALKLNIRSEEDNEDDVINYVEYFDRLAEDTAVIDMKKFADKVCFDVKLQKRADIKIGTFLEQITKETYKCFTFDEIKNFAQEVNNNYIIEVYINDKLKQEFPIAKPKEKLRMTFTDLALLNSKLDDFVEVKILNPSGNTMKLKILDSNIGCHNDNFQIADEYKLLCNKTKEVSSYYIQLEDDSKTIHYGSYQIPPPKKSEGGILSNKWFWIVLIGVIIFIALNNYRSKVRNKDKSAMEELENEDK